MGLGSFVKGYTFDDIQIEPLYSEVISRSDCNLSTKFTKNYNLSVPIISSPMDTVTGIEMAFQMSKLGGVGIIHRFCDIEEQARKIRVFRGFMMQAKWSDDWDLKQVPISAAIGATGDYLERAQELVRAGANVLLIDVAHGHHIHVKNALETLKNEFGPSTKTVDIIAGSVATHDGARDLARWGADAVRVGIGNGSLCETRIRTGIGVPQVTAIQRCYVGVSGFDIPIIADGGIRTPGDVAKALSLGADSVMLGSLLSGTRESPGNISRVGTWPNEKLFKKYRGSASRDAKIDTGQEDKNVEGNSTLVPYKGKIKRIVKDISDGVRSSMSYLGVDNVKDMRKCRYYEVTEAGRVEAKAHLLDNV